MTPAATPPVPPPAPTPSPTGDATKPALLLSNPYVAYGLLFVGVCLKCIAEIDSIAPEIHVSSQVHGWTNIVAYVLGSMGLISVGVRKLGSAAPMLLALLCGSLLLSSSCATMSSAEKSQLLDCGEKALAAGATTYAPQVGAIIGGQSPNWNADLGDLLVVAGEAGVCAVEVVIAQFEQGHAVTADIGGAGAGPAAAATVPIPVALMRAYSFKVKAGYRVKR